jgi:hypothetical protein
VTQKRIDYMAEQFQAHSKSHPFAIAPAVKGSSAADVDVLDHKYATSWLTQFSLLSSRSLRIMMREKANTIAMFAQTIIFALLLGLIWLREGENLETQGGIQALAGAHFFLLIK